MSADTADGTISLTGHCLCGAVRIAGKFPSADVDACHCRMCQRWTAGPFMTLPHGAQVTLTGEASVRLFKSSEWAERGFCGICGTPLFWRMPGMDHVSYSAGLIDDPSSLTFSTEIFIDEKPDYYAFANDTKKMTGAEVVAAFGDQEPKG